MCHGVKRQHQINKCINKKLHVLKAVTTKTITTEKSSEVGDLISKKLKSKTNPYTNSKLKTRYFCIKQF